MCSRAYPPTTMSVLTSGAGGDIPTEAVTAEVDSRILVELAPGRIRVRPRMGPLVP